MNGSNRPRIGGEATSIVQTLREFGANRPVPTEVVALSVGKEEEEISNSLSALAEKGVIKLTADRKAVTLVE